MPFFFYMIVSVFAMDSNHIEETTSDIIRRIGTIKNKYFLMKVQKQLDQIEMCSAVFTIYDFLSNYDQQKLNLLADIIEHGDITIVNEENRFYPALLINIVREVIKDQPIPFSDVVLKKFFVIPFSFINLLYRAYPQKFQEYMFFRVYDFIYRGATVYPTRPLWSSLSSNYNQIKGLADTLNGQYYEHQNLHLGDSMSIEKIQNIELDQKVWYNFISSNTFFIAYISTMYGSEDAYYFPELKQYLIDNKNIKQLKIMGCMIIQALCNKVIQNTMPYAWDNLTFAANKKQQRNDIELLIATIEKFDNQVIKKTIPYAWGNLTFAANKKQQRNDYRQGLITKIEKIGNQVIKKTIPYAWDNLTFAANKKQQSALRETMMNKWISRF